MTSCVSLVYGYLLGAPALLYAAAKYFLNVPNLGLTQLVCLLGYSLFLYVPGVVLATFTIFSWPALATAAVASNLFLVRSVKPALGTSEKALPVLGCLVASQIIFALVLKFQFYSHNTISALPV